MLGDPDMALLAGYFFVAIVVLGFGLCIVELIIDSKNHYLQSKLLEDRLKKPSSTPPGKTTPKKTKKTYRKPHRKTGKRKTSTSDGKATGKKRCDNCGGVLVVRTAKYGRYKGSKFYGCSNFPKCKKIVPIPGKTKVQSKKPRVICSRCGGPMVKRTAKRGRSKGQVFYGCSNFPRCRNTKNIN